MKLDLLATEPHFVDHLLPIWRALPVDVRGEFVTPSYLSAHRHHRGLPRNRPPAREAALVASWGDHKRARDMGFRHIARIEHGIGQSFGTGHPSYAGGRGCEDVELFLTPNDYAARLWQAAYPLARVAVVGCPKNDRLPSYVPTDPITVAVSFHWDGRGHIAETGSAFADYAAAVLALRDRNYRLIMHGHPKGQAEYKRWALRHRIPFEPDFEAVQRNAALYVCDGVSTLYEFAATGRPVVVVNALAYRPHVNHGLRYWDAADVGIQVDSPAALGAAIDEALIDAPIRRRNREAALEMVYAHRGDAAQRAARSLSQWARQPAEAVA